MINQLLSGKPLKDASTVGGIGKLQKLEKRLCIQQLDHILCVKAAAGWFFEPVGLAFGEDTTQLILAHRDQRFAGTHQVLAVEILGRTARSRWDVEDKHPPIRMVHFLYVHAETDGFKQVFSGNDNVLECLCTRNRAWDLIGDTQQQKPATFVS
jgi:hypothetical protein